MKNKNSDHEQVNNPLHGVKLADILDQLVAHYGWAALGDRIKINCFNSNPTVKSSLKFLRKTDWAREKVEQLYLRTKFDNKPSAAPKGANKKSKNFASALKNVAAKHKTKQD